MATVSFSMWHILGVLDKNAVCLATSRNKKRKGLFSFSFGVKEQLGIDFTEAGV